MIWTSPRTLSLGRFSGTDRRRSEDLIEDQTIEDVILTVLIQIVIITSRGIRAIIIIKAESLFERCCS